MAKNILFAMHYWKIYQNSHGSIYFLLTSFSNINYDDQDYNSHRHEYDVTRNNQFNGENHSQANNHHHINNKNENTNDEYNS